MGRGFDFFGRGAAPDAESDGEGVFWLLSVHVTLSHPLAPLCYACVLQLYYCA